MLCGTSALASHEKEYLVKLIRFSLAVLLVVLGGVVCAEGLSKAQLDDVARRIIGDYQGLVSGPSTDEYVMALDNFGQMVKQNKIALRVVEDPSPSLLKAMAFQVDWETGNSYIEFKRTALEMYEDNKSVIYSILTHELWHAYAYAQSPAGFKDIEIDPFEDAMYQADAYYVEAKFIASVLIPKGFKTSKFEQYLSECYRNHALSSFTAIFNGEDLFIIRSLYDIRDKRQKGTIAQGAVYQEATAVGNAALEGYRKVDKDSDPFEEYTCLIGLYTFNRYAQTLVSQTEKSRTN